MKEVADKVAFITGGASGLGLGTAKAFVAAGMKVAVADSRQDHLERALDELRPLSDSRSACDRRSTRTRGYAPRAGAGGPPPGALPPGSNPMDLAMNPQEVGEKVLRGILRNDLYILTHSEFGAPIREHFDAILAAFPSEAPGTPPASGAGLMRVRIYREGRTGNPTETGK